MATLTLLLVPLACQWLVPLHASAVIDVPNHCSKDLDLVITDEINDAIAYYNRFSSPAPPIALPSIAGDVKDKNLHLKYSANGGKLYTKSVKLAGNSANVSFSHDIGPSWEKHMLVATVPLTIKGLEIQYDTLEVDINSLVGQKKPFEAKPKTKEANAAVKASVGKNKFVVTVDMVHLYADGKEAECIQGVSKIAVEQFEVKRVNIDGADEPIKKVLEALVNEFKAKLVEESYAASTLATLIQKTALNFFPFYCKFVRIDQLHNLP